MPNRSFIRYLTGSENKPERRDFWTIFLFFFLFWNVFYLVSVYPLTFTPGLVSKKDGGVSDFVCLSLFNRMHTFDPIVVQSSHDIAFIVKRCACAQQPLTWDQIRTRKNLTMTSRTTSTYRCPSPAPPQPAGATTTTATSTTTRSKLLLLLFLRSDCGGGERG